MIHGGAGVYAGQLRELAILVGRQQVRPMVPAVFELSASQMPVRAQRARRDPGKVVISVASTAGR